MESQHLDQSEMRNILEISDSDQEDPIVKGYIDDLNVIERLDSRFRVTHHTTGITTAEICADKSGGTFSALGDHSKELGMKINPGKTQVLCISNATGITTKSFVRANGIKIKSSSELKILGVWFDQTPTVNLHVEKMLLKARSRMNSLRVLRRAGIPEDHLLKAYTTYVRPIIDYAVPTYHSQLSKEQAARIEQFQARSMKIVFGPLVAYHTVIEHNKIETHQSRRERLFKNFTLKTYSNPAFKDKWFPTNDDPTYDLRRRNKIKINRANTDRYLRSPIQAMRALLNENNVS